jgi:amidase
MDTVEIDIATLQQGMRVRALTSVDLVRACLGHIAAIDAAGPKLRAVLSLNPEAIEIAGRARRYGK